MAATVSVDLCVGAKETCLSLVFPPVSGPPRKGTGALPNNGKGACADCLRPRRATAAGVCLYQRKNRYGLSLRLKASVFWFEEPGTKLR